MSTERLPPPWTVKELPECFMVVDAEGKSVAYVYFRPAHVPAIGTGGMSERMSKDTARRVAVNIAKLPDLLSKA